MIASALAHAQPKVSHAPSWEQVNLVKADLTSSTMKTTRRSGRQSLVLLTAEGTAEFKITLSSEFVIRPTDQRVVKPAGSTMTEPIQVTASLQGHDGHYRVLQTPQFRYPGVPASEMQPAAIRNRVTPALDALFTYTGDLGKYAAAQHPFYATVPNARAQPRLREGTFSLPQLAPATAGNHAAQIGGGPLGALFPRLRACTESPNAKAIGIGLPASMQAGAVQVKSVRVMFGLPVTLRVRGTVQVAGTNWQGYVLGGPPISCGSATARVRFSIVLIRTVRPPATWLIAQLWADGNTSQIYSYFDPGAFL